MTSNTKIHTNPTGESPEPLTNEAILDSSTSPHIVIEPSSGWKALNIQEIWRYRDLLWILAARDVKLRYKQTALGVTWVILQPVVASVIFAIIFGRFANLPSNGLPYLLFVFCGLLPWNFFSGALQRAGNSLVGDARLISKVYFPRLLIPLASVGAVLIDFAVGLVVMAVFMVIYGVLPSWSILALPFFLFFAILAATGTSLWLSALNVKYRDFMYALPFLIQVWTYASPVVYSSTIVPERWQLLYSLNPAVGIIEGFRWSILGDRALSMPMIASMTIVSVGIFVGGAFFFRRVERSFADFI